MPRPVVIVTGALAPYTEVLYDLLAASLDRPLHVLACSARERARRWNLKAEHRFVFDVLPGVRLHRSSVTNHYCNPSVISRLRALDPAVLVLNDFSPTMVLAAWYARLRGLPFGIRTDGVPETDPGRRSTVHRLLRRAVVPHAVFGLGPSKGSRALLDGYGLVAPFHLSPLFPAWLPSAAVPGTAERPYDILFCGALNEDMKGAGFFTEVILGCAQRRAVRVRVVGDGPLRGLMQHRFEAAGVAARFDGFLQQGELGEAYRSARLFHFPSRGDVWGIVVNEALQSGTVVIASPHAGAARELLQAEQCGWVLALDRDAWTDATLALLDDQAALDALRDTGRRAVLPLTPERACEAYREALAPFLGDTRPQGPNRTSSV